MPAILPALIPIEAIYRARTRLRDVVRHTPLERNDSLSERYGANIFLKREDRQEVRSYKIRGAYNKMASLPREELDRGIVCASAGNHAQGVALACRKLKVEGKIFMPLTTPRQKLNKVKSFGREFVEVILGGDTFDDSKNAAYLVAEREGLTFVHPFDDPRIIEGQATLGLEILEDSPVDIDHLFLCLGGGGMSAGVGSVFKQLSPDTCCWGVEPEGAASMTAAFKTGEVVTLPKIDNFVDGAAVQRVGELTYHICREVLQHPILTVPEGKICTTILELYNDQGIVAEPAGALSVAALDQMRDEIRGKNVVCVVSGGNNDITRTEEIMERSLLYEGLKRYFIIQFPQRAGALREFLINVLGPDDDITFFEYSKKHNRERGAAVVGLQVPRADAYADLLRRMDQHGVEYQAINDAPGLFNVLV